MPRQIGKDGRIATPLRLPKNLFWKVQDVADHQERNVSDVLLDAVSSYVGRLEMQRQDVVPICEKTLTEIAEDRGKVIRDITTDIT